MTLTGRRRHRLQRRFGDTLLVLQVEETYLRTEYCAGYIDTETVTRWRDAKVEDLSEGVNAQ